MSLILAGYKDPLYPKIKKNNKNKNQKTMYLTNYQVNDILNLLDWLFNGLTDENEEESCQQ